MIGKNITNIRPVPLAEVVSILEKRQEEAEAEMKRRKKEKKVTEAPPKPPEGEGAGKEAPKEEKEEHPLGLEQRYALAYAKKFAHLSKKKAEEMYERLMKLEAMKPEAAMKIVDVLPKHNAQIEAILLKERISGEKLRGEISAIVNDFSK